MTDYDIIGDIAIIKSEANREKKTKSQKLKEARELLKIPSIKSVFEKIGNVKGRLRTISVKHVLGERNLIAKHKENGCLFKFNVSSCYFSPRLSGERKEIAARIKKNDSVLVMFAGVGAYPIVIYKIKQPKRVVGVEIGKECYKYFQENLKLNKMRNKIEVIQGDVKKKVNRGLGKFDVVIMARPNLKESFLKQGLSVCKKNSKIFYYGFCNIDEKDEMIKNLIKEAKKLKRKIKIIDVQKAGEIAPYKFRWRVEIKVIK